MNRAIAIAICTLILAGCQTTTGEVPPPQSSVMPTPVAPKAEPAPEPEGPMVKAAPKTPVTITNVDGSVDGPPMFRVPLPSELLGDRKPVAKPVEPSRPIEAPPVVTPAKPKPVKAPPKRSKPYVVKTKVHLPNIQATTPEVKTSTSPMLSAPKPSGMPSTSVSGLLSK